MIDQLYTILERDYNLNVSRVMRYLIENDILGCNNLDEKLISDSLKISLPEINESMIILINLGFIKIKKTNS